MELIVLGAGPAYTARRGAAASSYLVRHEGQNLLLDLGQGSFSNLAATVEPATLSAILISHLHPDHFVDLVALRHYLRWQFRPSRRVRVLAPAALAERLDAVNGQPGFAAATLDVEPLAPGEFQIGPFAVRVLRVTHDEDSYAFRVAAGAGPGLAYSGDCGRAADLAPLLEPGDTLLAEASFGAARVPRAVAHLNAGDAGRAATSGKAARLLLTHVQMGFSRADALAAAQAVFSGPIQFVTEGDRFDL